MASLLDKLSKKPDTVKGKNQAGEQTEKSAILEPKAESISKPSPNKETGSDFSLAYKVILRPLVSEKGTYLQEQNKYFFEVANSANKIMIKQAVETLYKVGVVKVNILNRSGKSVRLGRQSGRRKSWKKAVVTLKPGQRITTVEGV